MSSSRAVVVANKRFEAHGLLSALLGRPADLGWPDDFPNSKKLCVYRGSDSIVEVWCVEDVIPTGSNKADSQEKMKALAEILEPEPAIVVSLATAGYPDHDTENRNGCVVVGTKIFNHSCGDGEIRGIVLDKCLASRGSEELIERALYEDVSEINSRLLETPIEPAERAVLIAKENLVGITVVNARSYDDFARCDVEAVSAAKRSGIVDPICSVETTHGLVRCYLGNSTSARFVFISGITNTIGLFKTTYAQNFAASHNAGIAAGYLIAKLLRDSQD
jgi:hypothetical protein